jgi:hypothetical protein
VALFDQWTRYFSESDEKLLTQLMLAGMQKMFSVLPISTLALAALYWVEVVQRLQGWFAIYVKKNSE